jgi:RiboL-PSP-HEPN
MTMGTIVDQQYKSGYSLIEYLRNQKELTFSTEAENNFKKIILLSAASYFEKEISETVIDFASTHTNNNSQLVSFIRQKAVNRQYHTYFDWNTASNANSFFALFGEDFKKKMSQKVKDTKKLDSAIKAFLLLGQERNKVVHQNFAEITIEKTSNEIYQLYQDANIFIETLKEELVGRKTND